MAHPLPISLKGPISLISTTASVHGALPNAKIDIVDVDNSNKRIGGVVAPAGSVGKIWVPLDTNGLIEGHSLYAQQTTDNGTSELGNFPIRIRGVMDPVSAPVNLSVLNTCVADVRASGLWPGATISTKIGGVAFGSKIAQDTTEWLNISPTTQITEGSTMEITQSIIFLGSTKTATYTSLRIPRFHFATDSLMTP